MTSVPQQSIEDTWAFRCLLAGAFLMGFSMPASRLCIALALVLIVIGAARGKIHFVMPKSAWLWLALVLLAGVVTACGINPHRGLDKLHKLGWYLGIPVAATLVTSRERMQSVISMLIAGTVALAAIVLIRNPLAAMAIVKRFASSPNQSLFTFGNELAMQGSLIDGERLMVGLVMLLVLFLTSGIVHRFHIKWHQIAVGVCSLLAFLALSVNYLSACAITERFHGTLISSRYPLGKELSRQNATFPSFWIWALLFAALAAGSYLFYRKKHAGYQKAPSNEKSEVKKETVISSSPNKKECLFSFFPCALVLLALAEIVVLKRGSWICTLAIVGLLLIRRISWKWLCSGAIVLLAIALFVAPVRARLAAIPDEFDPSRGGRAAMWTKFAPAVIADHPWGIGFRSLVPDEESPYSIQSLARHYKLDVEFEKNRDHLHSNLVEMTTSLGWEGLALYLVWMGVIFSDALRGGKETSPVFWAIAALFLNGFVEYNFADAEIIIIMGVLIGLAAAGRRLASPAQALDSSSSTL